MSDNKFSLFHFLFESKVAVLVITANVYMYFFALYSERGGKLFELMVLYPGNLLEGNYWCVITSGFIHSSFTHLWMNMLGIFIFARVVERHLGFAKTLFIYFGALMISMLFSTVVYALALSQNVAIIGASGALMGLIAAAMLLDPFYISYELILPIPVMVKGWIFFYADLVGFLGGEEDGVSHLAHLFGFLSVGLLVYFSSKKDKKQMQAGLITNICSFILYLLLRNWIMTSQFSAGQF